MKTSSWKFSRVSSPIRLALGLAFPMIVRSLVLLLAASVAGAEELDLGAIVKSAPLTAKLSDPDYNIWCGAPIKGDDGKYHVFYSRWPRKLGHQAWVTNSEIAHAVGDSPLGPWKHHDVALAARGAKFWDGSCTHNPNIARIGGKYCLFYVGNYGDGVLGKGLNWTHRNHQRIGVAIADSPNGPWQRFDQPIVTTSDDKAAFDSLCVTNPAGCERADGGVLLVYKAVEYVEGKIGGGKVRYGAAMADKPAGPYTKKPGHIFEADVADAGKHWMLAEDPYIWFSKQYGNRYYAVARDVVGTFTGASGGIVLFQSEDGLNWKPASNPKVLGARYQRADGTTSFSTIERPALLFDGETPIVLFGAASDNKNRDGTFNVQIPLK
jgi:hypothetical protein